MSQNRNTTGLLILLLIMVVVAAGCNGLPGSGPRLVSEADIPTVAVLPSVTPSPTPGPTATPIPPTPDFLAETRVALITPTLPPSPTPTATLTPSNTPVPSITPSPTLPPTQTPFPTPSPLPSATPFVQQQVAGQVVVQPPPASGGSSAPPAAVDSSGNCVYAWFFTSRPAEGCPANNAITAAAAALAFERGQMFWTSHESMIYVLYSDGGQPAWDRFTDTWAEGMIERDPTIVGPQGLWQQPRRGFGNVWRTTPGVRDRLGWALREWEDAYTLTFQQAGASAGSTIYLTGPDGQIYALYGDRTRWERFAP